MSPACEGDVLCDHVAYAKSTPSGGTCIWTSSITGIMLADPQGRSRTLLIPWNFIYMYFNIFVIEAGRFWFFVIFPRRVFLPLRWEQKILKSQIVMKPLRKWKLRWKLREKWDILFLWILTSVTKCCVGKWTRFWFFVIKFMQKKIEKKNPRFVAPH